MERITAGHPLSHSEDGTEKNIEALKVLFPAAVREGRIDFEALKALLEIGGNGDAAQESEAYRFTWAGKSRAIREAAKSTTATLRPDKERSCDWDTTGNVFIEGDNGEVLKLLQRAYAHRVKMIYIDPPYNTGQDFVYRDNYYDHLQQYLALTGQTCGKGKRTAASAESNGRYHSNWLNMMYPRLMLARQLLREDGVIFISIDDHEGYNLRKIGNEIFGEENFVSCITRVAKTTSFRGNFFAPSKDYLLCYARDIRLLKPFAASANETQFPKTETAGRRTGARYRDDIAFYLSTLETRPNQRYFIECPDGQKVLPPGKTFPPEKPAEGDGIWRWNYQTYLQKKDRLVFKRTVRSPLIDERGARAAWNIYTKSYLEDKSEKGNIPRDVFEGFLNRHGSEELKKLGIPFPFPKPVALIHYLLQIIQSDKDDLILDFFAGSGTTAHAVMKRNAEDGGRRRYICVQWPEPVPPGTEAFKAGYRTLSELSVERIRRAGTQLLKHASFPEVDIGFRLFRLDSSCLRAPGDGPGTALCGDGTIKEGRTAEDVLFETAVRCGLPLCGTVEERMIAGRKVYGFGAGALFLCLEDCPCAVAEGIGRWKEELQPDGCRVVFLESGFSPSVKLHVTEILMRYGITEVYTI